MTVAGVSLAGKAGVSIPIGSTEENPFERGDLGLEILQDGNLGRTDVLAGAGVTVRAGSYALNRAVRVPVYQDIVQAGDEAAQLSYPAIL